MRRRDRRMIAAVVVIAVAALVAVVVLATRGSNPEPKGVKADRLTTLKVDDVSLAAEIITPNGAGRHPLLVMPASSGTGTSTYRQLAARFARHGYQVVSYAQRGFGGSTGVIDLAGPATQRDASAVITWALQHTPSDPAHIGMLGMSYGGGISLLTAAHDKRVRAVVATSTWTDLTEAFDQNNTPSVGALDVLLGRIQPAALDSGARRLQLAARTAPVQVPAVLQQISPSRSPSSDVRRLNANRPAIMIANAFEDSLFNPAQLIPFFTKLTTPKRLELARGDHGTPERAALSGAASATIDDAEAWLDHYLRGTANGTDKQPPIVLHDIRTSAAHTLTSWPEPGAGRRTALGRPGAPGSDRPTGAWRSSLTAGVDSAATSGFPQFGSTAANYRLPTLQLPALDPKRALVWNQPVLAADQRLQGTPTVTVQLASSTGTATVFAYLYDVSATGSGTLLDMAPYTITGLGGGGNSVTFGLQPTAYTVPAGHHVALVLDAADLRYPSLAGKGATITVSSSAAAPAALTLPVAG